ncbi:hypothetical protein BKA70DRAFT_1349962 [Coprinopsis sp. MPI-PUGE-AT-0042]|nr:hypothetical protein BKA70DRAFT_1349962 [Coprinopsis sp. MPI-PUGE-AT-0042]
MKANPALAPLPAVNDPIPDSLLEHLKEYLDHRTHLIKSCDEEIARLEAKRKLLRFQCDTYVPLRTPIRRVPGEVLAIIMHWGIAGPGRFVNIEGRADFLRYHQVSELWRRTAFSTPYLWRFLSVNFADYAGDTESIPLKILRWFGRAGKGADVHLDLENWGHPWQESFHFIRQEWDRESRNFQVVTLRLSDIMGEVRAQINAVPAIPVLRNLSMVIDESWRSSVRAKYLDDIIPDVESLLVAMSSSNIPFQMEFPFCHSNIRFLLLSELSCIHGRFAMMPDALPLLEELLFINCPFKKFELEPTQPVTTNNSIKRLETTLHSLASWQNVNLLALEYCRIISDEQDLSREEEEANIPAHAAKNLELFNCHNLTLDLSSIEIGYDDLASLLASRLPPLRSLRLHSLSPLFSEDPLRSTPPLPLRFLAEPPSNSCLGSSSTSLVIYAPNDGCIQWFKFMAQTPFELILLPPWKIQISRKNEFRIGHHEFM